jgi:hypothetical protein
MMFFKKTKFGLTTKTKLPHQAASSIGKFKK